MPFSDAQIRRKGTPGLSGREICDRLVWRSIQVGRRVEFDKCRNRRFGGIRRYNGEVRPPA